MTVTIDTIHGEGTVDVDNETEGLNPTITIPVYEVDVLGESGTRCQKMVEALVNMAAGIDEDSDEEADQAVIWAAKVLARAYDPAAAHLATAELLPEQARAVAAVLVHFADEAERWRR